jgi:predicted NUDIX family NTP pyrophosphohydrolase
MKKVLVVAAAIAGGAIALPGQADANPICDVWNAAQRTLDREIGYCIDDPGPLDHLFELQP